MWESRRASRRRAGFTLVELMLVVLIIAILATLAIPRMVSARVASQEAAAMAALRSIASAQAQLQSTIGIDTNADGAGEFGCLGELSGARPLRVTAGGVPAAGMVGVDELNPPALAPVYGQVGLNGVVLHKGYVYQIYLPSAGLAPVGLPEEDGGGILGPPFPDPTNGSIHWCAYTWPYEAGRTGRRVFFVNEQGEILASVNRGAGGAPIYESLDVAFHPAFSAAYVDPHMAADIAVNAFGTDGNRWVRVQ